MTKKTFRPWEVDQPSLLPPSVQDYVPEGHPAHFVRNLVRESLDLEALYSTYDEERGAPPFEPAMMVALLLYAYCHGVYSSRSIAKGCEERLDFMAVTGLQRPDFRTIGKFRRRHLKALAELFEQVLMLCDQAGLVKLGHVAIDGTKIKANASKRKAMSHGRMAETLERLEREVAEWLDKAALADDDEDKRLGQDVRGDEMPDWVRNKALRIEKIREAKAALEEQAERQAEGSPDDDPDPPKGTKVRNEGVPDDKAQRNFTDPDSRIMKTSDGFEQSYNAGAAVDAERSPVTCRPAVSGTRTHRRPSACALPKRAPGSTRWICASVEVDGTAAIA